MNLDSYLKTAILYNRSWGESDVLSANGGRSLASSEDSGDGVGSCGW
jgi:hypothetical protein